jgi:NADH dehydrogenase (ubiquinone) 1 alpha subcomplex subunit 9
MTEYPILYQLNGGNTKTVPSHVLDVASALCTMLNAPVTSTASTFVFPGPQAYTYNELINLVTFFTMKPAANYPTPPKALAKLVATAMNRGIWWPTVSPDEIERKYIDDAGLEALFAPQEDAKPGGWGQPVGKAAMTGIDGEPVKSWADLDIEPSLIEQHAIKYLRRYRDS